MKQKRPPDTKNYEKYIRGVVREYKRLLILSDNNEKSQKSGSGSSKLNAIKFLKRFTYKQGVALLENDQCSEFREYVSALAKKQRDVRTSFAHRHDNIFIWVLRLVVLHQEDRGLLPINSKTMSKYGQQMAYAALHEIHDEWLFEFLKEAGSPDKISANLASGHRINIEKRWKSPKRSRTKN